MERNVPTIEALSSEAVSLLDTLTVSDDRATLVTLSGELGAGKTTFTQALAAHLGVSGAVTSPTFVLEKVYPLPEDTNRGFARLVHIDAYRLDGGDALATLGWNALLGDSKNLIILEWPERVRDALPAPDCAITLTVLPDTSRAISYAYAR
ncbi:MAG TPA: tRNA (adenosine(37)-N6)-threonylcarbamoyltransferase complex ATPase subunit type 1 TsaE [Candidatus Paceibacterota bacterium]|jgi:tRNA threonylcarbamoyladenosine biosynthesis protein TsaE